MLSSLVTKISYSDKKSAWTNINISEVIDTLVNYDTVFHVLFHCLSVLIHLCSYHFDYYYAITLVKIKLNVGCSCTYCYREKIM